MVSLQKDRKWQTERQEVHTKIERQRCTDSLFFWQLWVDSCSLASRSESKASLLLRLSCVSASSTVADDNLKHTIMVNTSYVYDLGHFLMHIHESIAEFQKRSILIENNSDDLSFKV